MFSIVPQQCHHTPALLASPCSSSSPSCHQPLFVGVTLLSIIPKLCHHPPALLASPCSSSSPSCDHPPALLASPCSSSSPSCDHPPALLASHCSASSPCYVTILLFYRRSLCFPPPSGSRSPPPYSAITPLLCRCSVTISLPTSLL